MRRRFNNLNIILDTYGGNIGLAITQAIGLTSLFQWVIRQSAELENQMTSVERVLEYSNVPQESALESPPGNDTVYIFIGTLRYYDMLKTNFSLI